MMTGADRLVQTLNTALATSGDSLSLRRGDIEDSLAILKAVAKRDEVGSFSDLCDKYARQGEMIASIRAQIEKAESELVAIRTQREPIERLAVTMRAVFDAAKAFVDYHQGFTGPIYREREWCALVQAIENHERNAYGVSVTGTEPLSRHAHGMIDAAFVRGFTTCVSDMLRNGHDQSSAKSCLRQANITRSVAECAGVGKRDLDVIWTSASEAEGTDASNVASKVDK